MFPHKEVDSDVRLPLSHCILLTSDRFAGSDFPRSGWCALGQAGRRRPEHTQDGEGAAPWLLPERVRAGR